LVVRTPTLLQANEAELRRFLQRTPADRLATPAQRGQILQQFPTYAQAQAAITDFWNQRARIDTTVLDASLIGPMEALKGSFERRGGSQQQAAGAGRNRKQALFTQADEIKRQIQTAKQNMMSGSLTLERYLAEVRRLKVEDFTTRVLADRCPVAARVNV
jgi:hypothetical protein